MRPAKDQYDLRWLFVGSLVLSLLFPSSATMRQPSTAARADAAAATRPKSSTRPVQRDAKGATVAPRNPQIARILSEIDARNIERAIRKLVSFGTRNTLSDQNDPNRGIGAARDWLYSEFQKAAAESGGRMIVEKQTFEQPKAARVHSLRCSPILLPL